MDPAELPVGVLVADSREPPHRIVGIPRIWPLPSLMTYTVSSALAP